MTQRCVDRVRKDETMDLPPMGDKLNKRWTRPEMQYLLKNSKTMYIEDIALELGRTIKATKDKAFLMGCSIKSKGKSNE